MMKQAIPAIAGITSIQLGSQQYSVRKRVWGSEERCAGLTADLRGAGLRASNTRINGQRISHCVLYTGALDVTFGTALGLVERSWVVARLNQHLGVDLQADRDD